MNIVPEPALQGMSAKELRALPETVAYRRYFCDVFAEKAPLAFHALMQHRHLIAATYQITEKYSEDLAAQAVQRITAVVTSWLKDYGVESDWLFDAAQYTLLVAFTGDVVRTLAEQGAIPESFKDFPELRTLTALAVPVVYPVNGDQNIHAWEPRRPRVSSPTEILIPSIPLEWNPLEEDEGKFTTRAKKAFATELRRAISEVKSQVGPKPRVNWDHVGWYIAWKFGNWDISSLPAVPTSKGKKVSRSNVQYGIDQAAERLGLPKRVEPDAS